MSLESEIQAIDEEILDVQKRLIAKAQGMSSNELDSWRREAEKRIRAMKMRRGKLRKKLEGET